MKSKILLTIGITLVILFGALSAFTNQHTSENKKPKIEQVVVNASASQDAL